MENSGQNPGNKAMPQYPKASDELQKHIETIIPEVEKEDISTANAAPEYAAHQESAVPPLKEKADNVSEAPDDMENTKPLSKEQESGKSNMAEPKTEEKPRGAADDIETVSN